jgi:hypothetical protein
MEVYTIKLCNQEYKWGFENRNIYILLDSLNRFKTGFIEAAKEVHG